MNEGRNSNANLEPNQTRGKTALNDNELEGVSGGFELPTIIDLCQRRFVYQRCVDTPWGSCKNFSRVFDKKEETIPQTIYHYKGSCAKGCFSDVSYEDYI